MDDLSDINFPDETPAQREERVNQLEKEHEEVVKQKLDQLEKDAPLEERILRLEEMKAREDAQKELDELLAVEIKQEKFKIISGVDLYAKEFPAERWLIDKILPSEGITMFVGESGSGKSFLAIEVIRALLTNQPFLSHWSVTENNKILIIDKENGLRRLKIRMQGMGVPSSNQLFLLESPELFNLENTEFIEIVKNLVTTQNIKVIILDSFVDIMIGEESDPGDTQKVFDTLRQISSTSGWILLHHDAKPVPKLFKTAGQKTRGSSNIIAQVDNQFYLEKTKSPKIINIEQGKARDYEPVTKFQIEFLSDETGNMSGFRYLGEVKEEVKMIEEAQEFIFQYLKNNAYSIKEEMDSAGETLAITPRTIKDALNQMSKKGIIDFIKKPGFGNKHFYFLLETSDIEEE